MRIAGCVCGPGRGVLGVGVGGSVELGGARGVLYLRLCVFWLLFNFSSGGGR